MSQQSIYLDSSIIIGYFDEKDRDIMNLSRNVIHKAIKMSEQNPEIDIKIPSVVLGEFLLWCIRNECLDNVSSKFLEILKNLEADFPSPKKDNYTKAKSIMDVDERYESHDTLIITHALLDFDTKWFLTTEEQFFYDDYIEKEKERLGNNFKISDRF